MNTILKVSAQAADDPRRARILEGATTVFLAYGFQRTTMDDIARAAEISRPALYLVFRNKTDIYRALVAEFLEQTVVNAREALAEDGPLEERLARSLLCTIDMMAEVEQSPHGAEILDMKNTLAADILADGMADYVGLIEAAIARDAERRGVDLAASGLSAEILAGMLLDAFEGMKQRSVPVERQHELARSYIAVVAGAIRRPAEG